MQHAIIQIAWRRRKNFYTVDRGMLIRSRPHPPCIDSDHFFFSYRSIGPDSDQSIIFYTLTTNGSWSVTKFWMLRHWLCVGLQEVSLTIECFDSNGGQINMGGEFSGSTTYFAVISYSFDGKPTLTAIFHFNNIKLIWVPKPA